MWRNIERGDLERLDPHESSAWSTGFWRFSSSIPLCVLCASVVNPFLRDLWQSQNPTCFFHPLFVLMRSVIGGNDPLRLGTLKMRTPVGHHPVATVRCIPATAVADDGVIRYMVREIGLSGRHVCRHRVLTCILVVRYNSSREGGLRNASRSCGR